MDEDTKQGGREDNSLSTFAKSGNLEGEGKKIFQRKKRGRTSKCLNEGSMKISEKEIEWRHLSEKAGEPQ